jgi:Ner family transcriptional regulator
MEKQKAKLNSQLKRVKRPSKGWHKADVKCALEKRGYTLKRVAAEAGYCDRAAQMAWGKWWPAIEHVIARAIGVEPWEIWPERYNDFGQPVVPGNPDKVKTTSPGRPRNVKLRAVNKHVV